MNQEDKEFVESFFASAFATVLIWIVCILLVVFCALMVLYLAALFVWGVFSLMSFT